MASDDSPQSIPLIPPGRGVYAFLALLMIAYLAFLVYLYSKSTEGVSVELQQEHFRGMLLTALISIATALPIVWALGRRSLTLTPTELQFRGGFYRVAVPIAQLRLDAAEELSLFQKTEYAPRWRTNGIRLPGYRAGWFRLRNGDKAILYLTDPFRITRLPTSAGFVLLLSTDALLPALRERIGRGDAARGGSASAAAATAS